MTCRTSSGIVEYCVQSGIYITTATLIDSDRVRILGFIHLIFLFVVFLTLKVRYVRGFAQWQFRTTTSTTSTTCLHHHNCVTSCSRNYVLRARLNVLRYYDYAMSAIYFEYSADLLLTSRGSALIYRNCLDLQNISKTFFFLLVENIIHLSFFTDAQSIAKINSESEYNAKYFANFYWKNTKNAVHQQTQIYKYFSTSILSFYVYFSIFGRERLNSDATRRGKKHHD